MSFNADDFMNQTVSGPMSTTYTLVPEGEYLASIGSEENSVEFKSGPQKKDPTKTWVQLTLRWEIRDQSLLASLKRDRMIVRQQFFLDLDDSGNLSLDEGRNVSLGQVRAACGLNSGPFGISMLRGAGPAMVKISHTPDAKDPEKKYAEVARVAPVR